MLLALTHGGMLLLLLHVGWWAGSLAHLRPMPVVLWAWEWLVWICDQRGLLFPICAPRAGCLLSAGIGSLSQACGIAYMNSSWDRSPKDSSDQHPALLLSMAVGGEFSWHLLTHFPAGFCHSCPFLLGGKSSYIWPLLLDVFKKKFWFHRLSVSFFGGNNAFCTFVYISRESNFPTGWYWYWLVLSALGTWTFLLLILIYFLYCM